MWMAILAYLLIMAFLIPALCAAAPQPDPKKRDTRSPSAIPCWEHGFSCLKCNTSLKPEDGTHLTCCECRGVTVGNQGRSKDRLKDAEESRDRMLDGYRRIARAKGRYCEDCGDEIPAGVAMMQDEDASQDHPWYCRKCYGTVKAQSMIEPIKDKCQDVFTISVKDITSREL